MDKLKVLYKLIDKMNSKNDVVSQVKFNIEFKGERFDKEFRIKLDRNNNKTSSLKLSQKKLNYALFLIDMLDRLHIDKTTSGYTLKLNIDDFSKLPDVSCGIIHDSIHNKKRSSLSKVQYLPEVFSNRNTVLELVKMSKEFKKQGIEIKNFEPKNMFALLNFDISGNLIKLYVKANGIHIEEGEEAFINIYEEFVE